MATIVGKRASSTASKSSRRQSSFDDGNYDGVDCVGSSLPLPMTAIVVKAEGGSMERQMVAATPTTSPIAGSSSSLQFLSTPVIRAPMTVAVQSLSSKSAVGSLPSISGTSTGGPKTTFVFSSAKKYRMVLNIDLSSYANYIGHDGVFHGMLDLRVRLGPGAPGASTTTAASSTAAKSKKSSGASTTIAPSSATIVANNGPFSTSTAATSSPGMLLCHVETLIEQPHDHKEPDATELRQLLHVNDFTNAPVRVMGRRLCIITRIWPCLFSSSKRRTRHEEYDSVEYEYTLRSVPPSSRSSSSSASTPSLIATSTCHVCIVPKSSYYKWKQKKGKSRSGVVVTSSATTKKGGRRRRKASSDDDEEDDDEHEGDTSPEHHSSSTNHDGDHSSDTTNNGHMNGNDEAAAATIAALPHDGNTGSHRTEPSVPFALTTRATARRAAAAAALAQAHDDAAAAAAAANATSPRSVSSTSSVGTTKKRRRVTATNGNGNGAHDSLPPSSPNGNGNASSWSSPRSMSSTSSSHVHHGEFAAVTDRPDADDDTIIETATIPTAAATLVHQQGNAVNVVAWPPVNNDSNSASKRVRIASSSSSSTPSLATPVASLSASAANNLANSIMTLTVPYDNTNANTNAANSNVIANTLSAPFDPAMVAQWASMMGMQLPFAPNNGLSPMLQLQPVDAPFT